MAIDRIGVAVAPHGETISRPGGMKMWKKTGIAIQISDDCKVRIIVAGDNPCLWLGDKDFPVLGRSLADFADIRDGITAELNRLNYEGRKGDVSRNPTKDSSNGIQGI